MLFFAPINLSVIPFQLSAIRIRFHCRDLWPIRDVPQAFCHFNTPIPIRRLQRAGQSRNPPQMGGCSFIKWVSIANILMRALFDWQ